MIAQMANFKCNDGHYSSKNTSSSYLKPKV
jgi:hypothetical protein